MFFLLTFIISLTSFFTTELWAQTCELKSSAPIVNAAPSTQFLLSGHEGQILVNRQIAPSSVVRIFETNSSEPQSWEKRSEPVVISFKSVPDDKEASNRAYEGFTPVNSSIIRFIVPMLQSSLWGTRTFVIRICNKDKPDSNAMAIVQVPITSIFWARIVSFVLIFLFYVGFSLAVYKIRVTTRPFDLKEPEFKYPEFEPQRKYNIFEYLNPVVLTANSFNKGSIQKLQLLLFSLLVGEMVLSLAIMKGTLSELSETVVVLLGISGLGSALARSTTRNHDRFSLGNWTWLVNRGILPINEEDPIGPRWTDLVMTDRELDIYKVQTLIFSAIVAIALLIGGEEQLASFKVPTALLGILGLSQVVYIGGTLAQPPSIKELNRAITNLRELESKLRVAVERGVDTDAYGKLPVPLPEVSSLELHERKERAVNAMREYSKQANEVEIALESILGEKVESTKLEPELGREAER